MQEAAVAQLLSVRAAHYDLVANGVELGGGSLRLHSAAQQRVLSHRRLKVLSET